MNLIELQKDYNEKQLFIKLQLDKIKLLNDRMENIKATDIRDVSVLGHSKKIDISDLINDKVKIENDIKEMYKEIEFMLPIIKELENEYHKLGDRDKQIYIQRKIWGYSPVKIGIKWGITDRRVQEIIKNVEKQLSVRKSSHVL